MKPSEEGAPWVRNEDGSYQSPNEDKKEPKVVAWDSNTVSSNRIGSLNKLPSDGG
jgi:hypothetical protein|tara:strand:- start:269 stop:433 length:165 start_codon:yes stop_codon:yes gene_type:complete